MFPHALNDAFQLDVDKTQRTRAVGGKKGTVKVEKVGRAN